MSKKEMPIITLDRRPDPFIRPELFDRAELLKPKIIKAMAKSLEKERGNRPITRFANTLGLKMPKYRLLEQGKAAMSPKVCANINRVLFRVNENLLLPQKKAKKIATKTKGGVRQTGRPRLKAV